MKKIQEGCGSCKECEEHFYWNHMDDTKKHFFKVMFSNFSHSMVIPPKFSLYFKEVISETVHLKAPSGEVWDVGVTKSGDKIVLQVGWNDFVKAYCIEETDFLVFKYTGNSCFDVLMFDSTSCEKASAYSMKKKKGSQKQKPDKSDDSVAIMNKPTQFKALECNSSCKSEHGIKKPLKVHKSRSVSSEKVSMDQELESSQGESDVKRNGGISLHPKKAISRPRKDVGTSKSAMCYSKQESLESDEQEKSMDVTYFISRKIILTSEQEKRVRQLALAVQPGNPFFAAVMRRTNVNVKNSFLNIPRGFAVEHLPPQSQYIVLRMPKKNSKWSVPYLLTKQTRGLHGSWKHFVKDNKLKEGDICIFELMRKQKEITLVVHLFHE